MARKKRKRRSQQSGTVQKGWYEGNVKGMPDGFIRFRNPQKKKLSNIF